MSIEKKVLIAECLIIVLIVLGIVGITTTDLNLGIFKIIKLETLINSKYELEELTENISISKDETTKKMNLLESSKKEYETEKNKYEAISQESLNIIKEATLEESYDIEYMWIKLGNYAKVNNLTISIVEPGGNITNNNEDTNSNNNDETITSDEKSNNNNTSLSQNLTINVVGNYLDLAEFVFDVENDVELRFKLDKIKMFYAENNNVTANFEVKNIVMDK